MVTTIVNAFGILAWLFFAVCFLMAARDLWLNRKG